ncbi:sugar phosphate nucleotidyltransferase [Paenibacillus sp. MZ04-78.2]|uniref:sugar phosphate nucleotidyltransferase n=1 Tax=Paenibacillus sp. MZ04-78.2 TaxID=2962034 RepID=UPI0020B87D0F|nr:sugar phosphate nucleotidyltransferase [Paenibacillus sp. MZ04-78.2]MCP3773458.1 sugar phosphate nucleotidyltransferase [Paenibacillus sp. MZ04-78.2]
MKLVLLSGGSGKRLWPLSNDARSKQFLQVLQNDKGEKESMVQRVWRQLESAGLSDDVLVATGKSQTEILQRQLRHLARIVVEPERRDTFPAIALAATYLYSIVGTGLNEVVAVLPVDPYVENDFFHYIKRLEGCIQETGADLALIGVKPTYPSGKYGYIIPKQGREQADAWYRPVHRFTEKPSEHEAEGLIAQQALWNCGVFAFKLNYVINLLMEKGLPIQYEEMLKQYHKTPNISFDYEVVEKAERVVVVPYEGYWKDLGTWNTLTEEMSQNMIGKAVICERSSNTHVVNELDVPVTVIGLKDIVVAASPDGILVADKVSSPRLKELLKHTDQPPMYEEKRWGEYKVLDFKKQQDGTEVLTRLVQMTEGQCLSYHSHEHYSECWTIVSGAGQFALDGKIFRVRAGDMLHIPAGAPHSLRALTDMQWLEVHMGRELHTENTTRLLIQWAEIEQHFETYSGSPKKDDNLMEGA